MNTKAIISKCLNELTEIKLDEDYQNTIPQQAISMEIPYPTLIKYINGNTECPAKNIVKIARYYGVSTDYLLGLSNVKSTDTELKGVCQYTGLSEKTIKKLHERAEFDKKYPKYKNGLEHLDIFVENCGFYIFDYLDKYIDSVSLCGAIEKKFPNINFSSNDSSLVVDLEEGEIRRKTFSDDEKEAIEDHHEETEEKQPLYIYKLQKMFIEFAEKYGEGKKKQTTMEEFVKQYETHSNSAKEYINDFDASVKEAESFFTSLANKLKDGVNNGEHTGKTE